ncbi:hypothetical protein ACTXN7_01220 [Corynebacterium flavescens]|uniref:hypothetical protein n=1 Tax=Corynebacterium flavescens TaxID=28028 RepID=UPI0023F2640D|nr:hypothetical protein [Corynebacterium flavescens]MDN6100193.1 hypothetical protein [Corynebacterium flavescens]MDN6551516.1 hypothetical protein [Corynebacterium flavescens]MDN6600923.1 hypothetical protein [Corynebacterium flavescens]
MPVRIFGASLSILVLAAALSACSGIGGSEKLVSPSITSLPDSEIDLEKARAENTHRLVDPKFENQIEVIEDSTGIESARTFFSNTRTLIVAEDRDSALLRAASLAVSQRVPLVVYSDEDRGAIMQLVRDLEVEQVVTVGKVSWAEAEGSLEVVHDPGTTAAMGQFTAFQFTSKVVASPSQMVEAVAQLDTDEKTELKAAWEPLLRSDEERTMPAIEGQSRRDSQMAPNMIATAATPLANVINANAYGGSVLVMPNSELMASKASAAMVIGLEHGSLIALGPEFGRPEEISEKISRGYEQ